MGVFLEASKILLNIKLKNDLLMSLEILIDADLVFPFPGLLFFMKTFAAKLSKSFFAKSLLDLSSLSSTSTLRLLYSKVASPVDL